MDCTLFGRGGETFNQYMKKGQMALVEGRLKLDQWTTPEGDKRSKHEVVVDNFTFLGGGRGGEAGGRSGEASPAGVPAVAGASGGYEAPQPSGDDIPF